RLQAGGDVTQSAIITASVLGVATTSGNITLAGNNKVGSFEASDSAAAGTITFKDTAALVIGSVAADSNIGFAVTSGITTNTGNISVQSGGAVQVNQAIDAGTGLTG